MATAEHVIREVNLIARNFECRGRQTAAVATADHISRFWAPSLRVVLLKEGQDSRDRFSSIAREAISLLAGPVTKSAEARPPQTIAMTV